MGHPAPAPLSLRRSVVYTIVMFILQAVDLVKQYGGRVVVNHVSYHVEEGEIVGLLGRNGAGKTTSFSMTIGMVTPNSGQVIFNGVDISAELGACLPGQLDATGDLSLRCADVPAALLSEGPNVIEASIDLDDMSTINCSATWVHLPNAE